MKPMQITAGTLRKVKLAVLAALAVLIVFSNRVYLGKVVRGHLRAVSTEKGGAGELRADKEQVKR